VKYSHTRITRIKIITERYKVAIMEIKMAFVRYKVKKCLMEKGVHAISFRSKQQIFSD